ncbi:hypothetical protein ES319_D04G204500v1 [Gossypium barbadense]|uniref:TF-B3 domain-containing protein n=1 Tax=Gossypium barbadense TaxID=3634 RepID=A0A5J5RXV6_GOSBA|nr:hypothetical protein ES319_D04G204500v1 [Gossypium barbadense]
MESRSRMVFSKPLTDSDIKKRLAIPSKTLAYLPNFDGSNGVRINIMYGTKIWPIDCTVRRKGHQKAIFSGRLWRAFIMSNELKVGDRISLYKVQGEDGCSHFKFEAEKQPASASNQYGTTVRIFGFNISDEATEMKFMKEREIDFFKGGAIAMSAYSSGTTTRSHAGGDTRHKIMTDHNHGLSLDLNLRPPSRNCHAC